MQSSTKSEYATLLEREYQATVDDLNEGKIQQTEAQLTLLHLLASFFENEKINASAVPWFDLEPLIAMSLGERDYQTYKKNYLIGCFIAGLVFLGSSINQACLATAVFLGHKNGSPETSKKAYALYKSRTLFDKPSEEQKNADADHFIYLNVYRLKKVLDMASKPFPEEKGVKDAKEAYDLLIKKMETFLSEDEKHPVEIVR